MLGLFPSISARDGDGELVGRPSSVLVWEVLMLGLFPSISARDGDGELVGRSSPVLRTNSV